MVMAGMVYVDTDELVIKTEAYDRLKAEVKRLTLIVEQAKITIDYQQQKYTELRDSKK
jgi:hypothetical protein